MSDDELSPELSEMLDKIAARPLNDRRWLVPKFGFGGDTKERETCEALVRLGLLKRLSPASTFAGLMEQTHLAVWGAAE